PSVAQRPRWRRAFIRARHFSGSRLAASLASSSARDAAGADVLFESVASVLFPGGDTSDHCKTGAETGVSPCCSAASPGGAELAWTKASGSLARTGSGFTIREQTL